eukprot:6100339-Alexandrium_andersonii.AAC.1
MPPGRSNSTFCKRCRQAALGHRIRAPRKLPRKSPRKLNDVAGPSPHAPKHPRAPTNRGRHVSRGTV